MATAAIERRTGWFKHSRAKEHRGAGMNVAWEGMAVHWRMKLEAEMRSRQRERERGRERERAQKTRRKPL